MEQNFDSMKEQIKSNVKILIDSNKIDEAYDLIEEYFKIVPNDAEAFTMKAVILIIDSQFDKAELVLKSGLEIDNNYFDLNYNLAFLYEKLNKYNEAVLYYKRALEITNDETTIAEINEKISTITKTHKVDLNLIEQSKNQSVTIRKVLFIQSVPCIRTNKVAKALSQKGIQVDILYSSIHPSEVYKNLKLPYENIYKLQNVNEMIEFINYSDYDILYSSNEPDYLTVLFTATNKPIIHDTHDMMSLRADINNEQVVLEYMANVKSTGNIYVNPMIMDIAVNKFDLKNKPILSLQSYIEEEQLPSKYYEKLSKKDGQIHCVFEGGLHGTKGHHRYLEPIFLKLAENHIHVHLHCPVDEKYINELVKKSKYIHYEGVTSPQNLIVEMTKYDIGLAIFNLTERNKTFLDTAFPNKIWDYLAAGLPIMFADLISFRQFAEESGVGKVLNLDGNIRRQFKDVLNIKIGKDFLVKNKFTMNNRADEIIEFLCNVKNNHFNKSNEEQPTKSNINKKDIVDLINQNKFDSAIILIEKCKSILDDPEVSYYESLIYTYQNEIEKAEKIIRKALGKYENNFYLLFGLACIEEIKGNYLSAINYYKLSIKCTIDKKQKDDIEKTVKQLENKISNDKIEVIKKNLNKSKILILRTSFSVFIKELVEKVHLYYGTKFDILTFDNRYRMEVSQEAFSEVMVSPNDSNAYKDMINQLDYYDSIHIHYLTPIFGVLAEEIRRKCNKLTITIWGSDFYRSENSIREIQRNILSKADIIIFDNEITREDFLKYFGEEYREKTRINIVGLTVLEHIEKIKNIDKGDLKKKYDIPSDSIVVTCGYNATYVHNHLNIIDSILKVIDNLPNNLFFIFPMTYGREENYINQVKKKLEQTNLKYKILEEFTGSEIVAQFDKISDIMIQLQTTDTLSASMLERMYCENIVITGQWLPYKVLTNKGVYFVEIENIELVGEKLKEIVNNIKFYKNKCMNNPKIIWEIASWESNIEKWRDTFIL